MLGEPLGLLGEQILQGKDTKKILDSDVKELAISKILDSLFKNLDVKETMTVIETLCKQVYFNGQPLSETFDVHFQADYVHLFKVIKTALEVQYGNFFQGIAGLQGLNAQATTQEPQT
jgi:hypothetical protein